MGQNSAIEWTDHTFNPWWGCVKVSAGCTNCYADTLASRYGHQIWGKNAERRLLSDSHWQQPLKWQRSAQSKNRRYRVFCASMADVFEDNEKIESERQKLWKLIEKTQNLDWLLLTKRPENMVSFAPWKGAWPDNVWAMTSVENQEQAEVRMPHLVNVPAKVRGISAEPLIGPVDLSNWISDIHWVIVGGESGGKARPMHPQWATDLRDACMKHDVAYFFKQWGNWSPTDAEKNALIVHYSKNNEQPIVTMKRSSKKLAGRLLESEEWNGLPIPQLV